MKTLTIGTHVALPIDGEYDMHEGKTIENVCSSPTQANPRRMVVRVRWFDKYGELTDRETIENIDDLII